MILFCIYVYFDKLWPKNTYVTNFDDVAFLSVANVRNNIFLEIKKEEEEITHFSSSFHLHIKLQFFFSHCSNWFCQNTNWIYFKLTQYFLLFLKQIFGLVWFFFWGVVKARLRLLNWHHHKFRVKVENCRVLTQNLMLEVLQDCDTIWRNRVTIWWC